jgi:hypothetical protein
MLALLGPCFTAGLANAQEFSGNFTLPFEARWGLATQQRGITRSTCSAWRVVRCIQHDSGDAAAPRRLPGDTLANG